MERITKNEFYELINPRDICVSYDHSKNRSYFKTRGGTIVGICEYYDDEGTKDYYIYRDLLPPIIGGN